MNFLLLLGGLAILLIAGELLVRGATALALRFKISTLVVGVTVVSFGTSAPELVISLKAALTGHPDISIGNIIGSNIANLALVLGLTAAIFHINVSKNSIKIDWPVMMIASLVFTWFIWDGALVMWEGIVFLAALTVFVTWLIRKSRKDEIARADDQKKFIEDQSHSSIPKISAYLIVGCIGLAFGAEWLVQGAIGIAESMGISEAVISLTVIAFGTSVPELATSIIALVKKESDISIGNLIGSNIFNILGILGITALFTEISGFDPRLLNYDIWWMLGISFIVLVFMISHQQIRRGEGIAMLALYFVYIATIALNIV
ncbi:MAG: calcium/sodium antiporter [Flavobacteriales bacterium]|nr:calcium/sodium antiporter [Flavobacteriales bacterium]